MPDPQDPQPGETETAEAGADASDDETALEPRADSLGARVGLRLVRFYQQALSPLFPPSCRYQPSCSEYTRIAIQRYGLVRGSWMGLKRVLRCHPFHPGGHDPVP